MSSIGPVVILIIAHKKKLEWHEEVSLQQCFKVLGSHPIRMVCPEGLDVSAYRKIAPELKFDFIPPHWLATYRAFNRLKILPFIYERYSLFDYILFYELDAFVFRDELLCWCEQEWDYIGAPWFEGNMDATFDARPTGVGNGGFSLRRVSSMLKVTRCWKAVRSFEEVFSEWRKSTDWSPLSFWRLFRNLTWRNCFHRRFNGFTDNEDMFWSFAGQRIKGFRLASYQLASRFSFDCNPERLFIEQGKHLPFGCHKWCAIQPDFWKPFIEAEGYRWPDQT